VNRYRVRHEFYHCRARWRDEDLVRTHLKRNLGSFPDLEQSLHKLDGEHLLSAVIIRFYYYRPQSVGIIIPELAYLLVLTFNLIPSFFEGVGHQVRWTYTKNFEITDVDLLPLVKIMIVTAMARTVSTNWTLLIFSLFLFNYLWLCNHNHLFFFCKRILIEVPKCFNLFFISHRHAEQPSHTTGARPVNVVLIISFWFFCRIFLLRQYFWNTHIFLIKWLHVNLVFDTRWGKFEKFWKPANFKDSFERSSHLGLKNMG